MGRWPVHWASWRRSAILDGPLAHPTRHGPATVATGMAGNRPVDQNEPSITIRLLFASRCMNIVTAPNPRPAVGPPSPAQTSTTQQQVSELVAKLEANISQVVLGKPEVVRMCLVALLSGEHVLLEDVPGVGKTLVAKALAKSVSGQFCRLQFTPDLLPSDILGSSVYDAKEARFVFHRGPIFANIVLADEVNRAPPRTQSALLEAMSEGQVSVDGQTMKLPTPFLVIATQNPYEFEGTYSLPESQLDRFLVRISVGYPAADDERRVLSSHRLGEPVQDLQPAVSGEQILQLQQAVRQVRVDDSLGNYLLEIVHLTRQCPELRVGVSTRGALSLYRAAQSLALIEGRAFVIPDDIKRLTPAVLAHRVLLKGLARTAQREVAESIIQRLTEEVAVPR
jgi:MoxR-like ATPase